MAEATNVVMTSKKTRLYSTATAAIHTDDVVPLLCFLPFLFSAPTNHPVCIIPYGKVHTGRSHAPGRLGARQAARRRQLQRRGWRKSFGFRLAASRHRCIHRRGDSSPSGPFSLSLSLSVEQPEEEDDDDDDDEFCQRTFIPDPLWHGRDEICG